MTGILEVLESEIQFWILMAKEQNIQIVILMILLDEFTGIFSMI